MPRSREWCTAVLILAVSTTSCGKDVVSPSDRMEALEALPAELRDTPIPFQSFDLGVQMSCGIARNYRAFCWGLNNFGQAGNGTTTSSITPVPVSQPRLFVSLSATYTHVCAINMLNRAFCWGDNTQGQLGNGTLTRSLVPVRVKTQSFFHTIAAGAFHTCGLNVPPGGGQLNSNVLCWGANGQAQIGLNFASPVPEMLPQRVLFPFGVLTLPPWMELQTLTAGLAHTCGFGSGVWLGEVLHRERGAWCWGSDLLNPFGLGRTPTIATNPTFSATSITIHRVEAGADASCFLSGGAVYCAGLNLDGQLGNGLTTSDGLPGRVTLPGPAIAVTGPEAHTCALLQNGRAYCWGRNTVGQLGDGTTTQRLQPVLVATNHRFTAIDVGNDHTCALARNDRMYCWGGNGFGQLGDGTYENRPTPVAVVAPTATPTTDPADLET